MLRAPRPLPRALPLAVPVAVSVAAVVGAALALPAAPAYAAPAGCPRATVTVSSTDGLKKALREAGPGTTIGLANGAYQGPFTIERSGRAGKPLRLCGGRGAVLRGKAGLKGNTLHLEGVHHVEVRGLTIRGGLKGLMADRTTDSVLAGLLIERVGHEALHLRSFSKRNTVTGNTIRRTGLKEERFGEGIYVGSAQSNWGKYSGGKPDRSDGNVISRNTVSATTAESVDIKEGTSGGRLVGNRFDGRALSTADQYADSWVDVKGNGWVVTGNVGRNTRRDGFQVHSILDGWGKGNVFSRNRAVVGPDGLAINVDTAEPNTVRCDNTVSGGARLSNVTCA
ncbi:right-handed parallel beta-helix repeat-containing protein [Motilibacter aurantiacus]|uniref:right-handed parallel beta-helix repeat-containing protein n=1 Tax=Motilibacter aurantiacus TaxID=2714955 RepID=UPI00140A81A5|nr:right-handed parallel beta-helix repeat-containing protein [Motilibacter aurantiacus]NHC45244.1 hypothetical protein [Motilibacter aurantiacus]